MSTRPAITPTAVGDRIHGWVEEAGWRRPRLDRAAVLVDRPTVRPVIDRGTPTADRPSGTPTVTVVIPCYNYAGFLPAAVASAFDQPGCAVDVVVVDDASTDATPEVAAALAADPRVRVFRNPENLGHVATFNRGLARAGGELVIRLDADDLLAPGAVTRAAALFEARPEVGLVYGHPRHFTTAAPPPARVGRPTWTIWEGRDWVRERCRRGVNCLTTPEVVFRSSVVEQAGPLNEALRYAQDMEFCLRVAALSDVARIDDVDQALHRDHDASMSVTVAAGVMVDLVERRQVFRELFDSVGARFPDRDELGETWRCTLADEAFRHASRAVDRGRDRDDDLAELRAYALETAPVRLRGTEAARWDDLERRRRRPTRPGATVRAARHRLRDEVAYLRWARTGI